MRVIEKKIHEMANQYDKELIYVLAYLTRRVKMLEEQLDRVVREVASLKGDLNESHE